ncbi:MAG: hypothetical protein L0Z53_17510, partial [Acidobacteriales bacterium]|nr:hypothetical protein [Terriglobales bacterium]
DEEFEALEADEIVYVCECSQIRHDRSRCQDCGEERKMRKPVLLKVTFRSKKDTALAFAEPEVIFDVVSRTTHLGGRCILLRIRPSACGTWEDVSKFREIIASASNVQSVRRKLRQSL